MSNPIIEIPEEVKATAQRVVAGRECYMGTTVAMAEFVLGLNKPEIEVQNFVVYKVKYADMFYAGFRFEASHCWKKWLIVELSGDESASLAIPQFHSAKLVEDEEVEVLERWTPEAPQPEFGIGESDTSVLRDREVLVKGVLNSTRVDSDGDVRVEMKFGRGTTETHYVSAEDVAYAKEAE